MSLMIAAALLAASSAPPQSPANADAEVVCRVERETGSRIAGRRVCRTVAEWRAEDRMNQDDVRKSRRRTGG